MNAGSPPNPKVRRTGAVLVVLAVLCGVGAVTGWDAPGPAGRIVLGVVTIVLLVLGLLLWRSRAPRVDTLTADETGLRITVAGQPVELLPWTVIHEVRMPKLGTGVFVRSGYLLAIDLKRGHPCPARLRPLSVEPDEGPTHLLIGLDKQQASGLRSVLGPDSTPPSGGGGRA